MIMDKEQIYAALEDKLLTYRDLLNVPIADCGEPMLPLSKTPVCYKNFDKRMEQYTGEEVYVREGLINLLKEAQKILNDLMPGHTLQVFYGYRHPEVQRSFYEDVRREVLQKNGPALDEITVKEMVHRFVAVPEVAGHSTGGAVDICVLDAQEKLIDMGTDRHENSKDSYVFSPFINKTAWTNRQKLRQSMLGAGFCPFDGEWWHFSYGDREWACYYKKENAIYSQIAFTSQNAVYIKH